jgi:hypothetical protein
MKNYFQYTMAQIRPTANKAKISMQPVLPAPELFFELPEALSAHSLSALARRG